MTDTAAVKCRWCDDPIDLAVPWGFVSVRSGRRRCPISPTKSHDRFIEGREEAMSDSDAIDLDEIKREISHGDAWPLDQETATALVAEVERLRAALGEVRGWLDRTFGEVNDFSSLCRILDRVEGHDVC